jgi:hypothetical protein
MARVETIPYQTTYSIPWFPFSLLLVVFSNCFVQIPLLETVLVGFGTGAAALLLTVVVDSVFWRRFVADTLLHFYTFTLLHFYCNDSAESLEF